MGTYGADSLGELKHLLLRAQLQRYGERGRPPSNQSMTHAIKMFIGDWYVDELGVWTREVKALD